jgi:EmrB/QacA subfamily drug resistance transporter
VKLAAPDSTYRWWALGLVIMGVFMAVLDSSIVNVALPHIMSAFEVNRDQVEWVTTAFMLATAVAMPLVGWLAGKIGYRTLYMMSLALFTLGSAACAVSWSFSVLVIARVLQALGGGAIQPVGLALIAELFEPHERGKALGIWGMGIVIGPTVGPTLGGYLTDWFSWRAIFTVNLPIGALGVLATGVIMRETGKPKRSQKLDLWGFCLLSLALITGLLALSNGQEKGWTSDYVLWNAGLAIAGMIMFIAVESAREHPLLDLKLFKIRNYSLVMVLAVFRSVGLFGGVFLLPIFLERLAGYTTIDTGLWMMPGALTLVFTMPIAGRMADRYHPAVLATIGTFVTGASLCMYGWLDPTSSAFVIIMPQVIRGFGLALMMAPLSTAALNSVPRAEVATASAFLAVSQRVGGAFGIAVLNTYVTNAVHSHAVRLGAAMPPQSLRFAHATYGAGHLSIHHALGASLPPGAAPMFVAVQTFLRRATILAYQDGFIFAGVVTAIGLPLCLFVKRTVAARRRGAAAPARAAPAPAPTPAAPAPAEA